MRIGIVAIISPLDLPYAREWLDYHFAIGASDIWLFLNDWSEEQERDMDKIQTDFPNGLHLVRKFNGKVKQLPAYNIGIQAASCEGIDWCAFIDLDEFIKVRSNRRLADVLAEHSNINQLAVNWRLFGSNGLEDVEDIYDPDPLGITDKYNVLGRFPMCEGKLNKHVKQLVNLSFYRRGMIELPTFINPHFTNGVSYNLEGSMFYGPFNVEKLDEVHEVEISHYIVKSRQECKLRREYRRADTGGFRDEGWEGFFNAHDKNEVRGDSLFYSKNK